MNAMNTIFLLLSVQAVMGAFDNLWHHELEARLPQRISARYELALHAAREAIYGIVFFGLAWFEWRGAFAALVAALLVIELGITLADFLEEDRTRRLPPFERLPLERITVVSSPAQALSAQAALMQATVWGFDTESKPTFFKDQVSDGPHVAQFATPEHAWVFQLHDPKVKSTVAELLSMPDIIKAGFGLGDDRKRIQQRLGVDPPL